MQAINMALIANTDEATPAQKLVAAVIARAINDVNGHFESGLSVVAAREARTDALHWLRTDADLWLTAICPEGSDASDTQQAILEMIGVEAR